MDEDTLEIAIEEAMDYVDDNPAAGTSMPKETSIAYYKGVIEECKLRIRAIKEDEDRDDGDELTDLEDED